jgi:hypothetical protein
MAQGFRMEVHYRDLKRLPPELEQGAIWHEADDSLLSSWISSRCTCRAGRPPGSG